MTFDERFDFLYTTYGKPADFSGIKDDLAAEITLTDAVGGGKFYIEHKAGQTRIEPYDYRDATVRIRLPYDLLVEILEDKKSAVAEFMASNVDAEGEPAHALARIGALRAGRLNKEGRRKKTAK